MCEQGFPGLLGTHAGCCVSLTAWSREKRLERAETSVPAPAPPLHRWWDPLALGSKPRWVSGWSSRTQAQGEALMLISIAHCPATLRDSSLFP